MPASCKCNALDLLPCDPILLLLLGAAAAAPPRAQQEGKKKHKQHERQQDISTAARTQCGNKWCPAQVPGWAAAAAWGSVSAEAKMKKAMHGMCHCMPVETYRQPHPLGCWCAQHVCSNTPGTTPVTAVAGCHARVQSINQ